jgi:hypothetical protein
VDKVREARNMKENILFSFLAVWLLIMGAAGQEIINCYGVGKFITVGFADVLMIMSLIYKVEKER